METVTAEIDEDAARGSRTTKGRRRSDSSRRAGVLFTLPAVFLLTVFMVVYVFLGGMRSVALTDVVQGVMIFTLMGIAVVVSLPTPDHSRE